MALPILLFFGLCLSTNLHAQDFVPDVNAYQSDITVDGSNDDWAGINSNPTFVDDDSDRKDNWTGPDDCEVTYKVAYGAEMLYLWFDIVDPDAVIYGDDNITEGDGFWEVDNMEICIDVDNSGGESKDELNDFQLRVMRGVDVKPGTSDWLHVLGVIPTVDHTPGSESSVYGTDAHDGLIDGFGFEIAQTETANGWTLEVGIPYSFLTKVDENIAPEDITSGDVLGLAVQYMDRDAFDEVERVALRSNDDHSPGDPSTWGSVTLNGDDPYDTTDDMLGAAQGEHHSNTAENAFANDINLKWLDFAEDYPDTRSSWIQYKYANNDKYIVSSYTITSANDAPERDDKDWELLGSNDDGATWTTLDTKVGETFSDRHVKNTYGISNSTAYNIYRLKINCVYDTSSATSVQLAEIEFIGLPDDGGSGADTKANGTLIGSRAYWQSICAPVREPELGMPQQ